MRIPTAKQLLLAWETGLPLSPTGRAIALLAAASPLASPGRLAALPVGLRDNRLLRLRRALFGETMAALAACPACGERLELRFGIGELCGHDAAAAADGDVLHDGVDDKGGTDADTRMAILTRQFSAGDYEIRYRLPTSADLLSVQETDCGAPSRSALLRRCVSAAWQNGAAIGVGDLPQAVTAALSEAMAAADPQAKIELALLCPACGHAWSGLLDIAGFLWREVDAWARRTLLDVHTLARAYGWSEAQILALTPRRRDLYLEMVRA